MAAGAEPVRAGDARPADPIGSRWRHAVAAILAGLAAAIAPQPVAAQSSTTAPPATSSVPSAPSTGLARWFDPATSPFIPIPEVGTDPNSGTTLGFLPVFLVLDDKSRIERIYAPDVIVNPDFGWGARGRVFAYPSDDRQWYVVAGAKERIEREFDALYTTGLTREGPLSLTTRVVYDRSGSRRFWGTGNQTPAVGETNYTNEQAYLDATLGFNLSHSLQVALNLRPRQVQIEPGHLGSNPSIERRFPGLAGLGTEHELQSRLLVTWDTRDSITLPTRGSQITGFVGAADRGVGSSRSYSVLGIDAKHFWPVHEHVVIAGHASLRTMPDARNAPFWALSSLGGDRSVIGERQPLRGYGEDRFMDRHAFSASLEFRTRVWNLHLFATDLSVELAPFVDAGRVYRHIDGNPIAHLHAVGGLGVRAVARPFLVGYVDAGYGGEGLAVFSGLGYAF